MPRPATACPPAAASPASARMWSWTSSGAAPAVEATQQPGLLVVVDQRRGLARVDLKARADRLLVVVVALDQARAVLVADALALGRVEVDVVDVPALGAHAAPAEAAHDLLVGHLDQQRRGQPALAVSASASPSASACCSLRGKPSSRKPSRASPLADARADHADDHLVGHELAGVHVLLRLLAQFGALGHLRAQHVAGGDVRERRSPRCRRSAWVPLPAPGGPSRIRFSLDIRRSLSARQAPLDELLQEALVTAHHQLRLQLLHRFQRDADHDQDRGAAEAEVGRGCGAIRIVGSAATAARNSAPGNVRRARMRSRNSAVGRPGRTPGMKPPYFLRLSAWSTGLKVTAV